MNRGLGALSSCLAVLVLSSPALAVDLPDVIVGRGDKKIKCEVQKEGVKEVTYKDEKGKTVNLANDQVVRIEFKDFPADLAMAENAIDRRDYFKAEASAEDAIKSVGEGRFKDLFLTRACVAKAKALFGQAHYKEAAEVAKKGIDAANGSKWAVKAHFENVRALAAAGDDACGAAGGDAEKACDEFPNDISRDFKAEIALAEGDYFLKKGDTSKAKEKYGTAENSPKLLDRAKLGRAWVKIAEKDLKGAEDAFREIGKSTQDPDALAGAQLGLGETALQQAKRSNPLNGDELRTTLEVYLRGAVLAQPSSTSDYHEKTLKGAAEVCELIAGTISVPADKKAKDFEKQTVAKKYFVDYARKLYEDLVKTYPSAQDADKYKQKISDLRAKSVALAPPAAPEANK